MGLISASSRTITRDIGGQSVTLAKLGYRDKAKLLVDENKRLKEELIRGAKECGEPIPTDRIKSLNCPDESDGAFVRFVNDAMGDSNGPRAVLNRLSIVEYAIAKANPGSSPEDVEVTAEATEGDLLEIVCAVCNFQLAGKEAPTDPLTTGNRNAT